MATEGDRERVRQAFLRLYAAHRKTGEVLSLERYQNLFPGYWDLIAEEFARLGHSSEGTRLDTPQTPAKEREGDSIGPYRILRELGRGGMGVVYLAEDAKLKRRVALKVLSPAFALSSSALARFRREAQIASRLEHPGVCTVFDSGEADGVPYIAMRFVEGETLAEWIAAARGTGSSAEGTAVPTRDEAPPADPARTTGAAARESVLRLVALGEKVARVLHEAHEAGLIHRDIKPGNIMVTRAGEPVLLDFGLAREEEGEAGGMTMTGALLGTPAYMSPEQLMAQRIRLDRRTDVYSLGVTLYEALTLRLPFDAPTREGLYQRILTSSPEDPRRLNRAVPRDLGVVLATALEKDRDRRYLTAKDLADELQRVREGKPVRAKPVGPIVRLARWARRNPAIAMPTATSFLILAAALATTLVLLDRVEEEDHAKTMALVEAGRHRSVSEARGRLLEASLAEQGRSLARIREHVDALNRSLKRAEGLRLAALSATVLPEDPGLALLLGVEAADREPGLLANNAILAALESCHEERALVGFGAGVCDVSFHPDGTRVVAASADGTARVFEVPSGKEILVLRTPEGGLAACSYSPDGDRILTARQEGPLRVWDARTGAVLAELEGHADMVEAAAFSPDGRIVLTASADGTARTWDAATGRRLRELSCEGHWVADAAFSPEGSRIATITHAILYSRRGDTAQRDEGTVPGDLRLWDAEGGAEVVRIPGGVPSHWLGGAGRSTLSFSPDGGRIAAVRADGSAGVWDAATGRVLWEARVPGASAVAFSPDGACLAVGDLEGFVRLLDAADGRERWTLPSRGRGVHGIAFRPDGGALLAWDEDRTVRVLDAATGRESAVLRGHGEQVLAARWSPDGKRVATASGDRTARFWDPDRTRVPVLGLGGPEIESSEFAPSGGRLATRQQGHRATIWDSADGRALARLGTDAAPVGLLRWSPDGRRLLAQCERGRARVFDTDDGKELLLLEGHTASMYNVQWDPAGRVIATASADGKARLWDVRTGAPVGPPLPHGAEVIAACFSASGTRLATAALDGLARVWDTSSGRALRTLDVKGGRENLWRVWLGPDGTRLLAKTYDPLQRASLWDVGEGRCLLSVEMRNAPDPQFSPDGSRFLVVEKEDRSTAILRDAATGELQHALKGHRADVRDLAFSADGTRVLTVSQDRTARVWDARDGTPLAVLRGHEAVLGTGEFDPTGRFAITAGRDRTVRVWRVETGEEWMTLREDLEGDTNLPDAEVSPDGTTVLTGNAKGCARLWPLDPPAHARTRLPRALTQREKDRYGLLSEAERAAFRADPDSDAPPKGRGRSLWGRVTMGDPASTVALRLNNEAWEVVKTAGGTVEDYRAALDKARKAVEKAPADGAFLNTLGVALYRAGEHAEAAETLRRSDVLNTADGAGGDPADVAFLAMALHRLGRAEEAAAALERLRHLARDPAFSADAGAQGHLREAEETIQGRR